MQLNDISNKYFNQVCEAMRLACNDQWERNPKQHKISAFDTILSKTPYTNEFKPPIPKTYFLANKLFRPLSEIMNSFECLENILVYVRSFPYKRQGISRVSYLKYHVENYLNELYILKNRLVAYCMILERAYRKSDNAESIAITLTSISQKVHGVFEGYISIRGVHVHEHRFSDHDFDRLASLELLTTHSTDLPDILICEYNEAYKEIRTKWVAKIESDLKALEKLLDYCFTGFSEAITCNDTVLMPKGIK